ncbi:MAG: cytochrome d ubiquinol oxidase subunit II [Eggerthellaceae bacterium]|jgi:cytochrome d ubiquinol oxidase subunit II
MTALGVLWFFLVFVLIAGYFILDGFDLGAGVLSPFVAKTEDEQAMVRRAIGPVWDGNEVWLLTAGGALFAAFPAAYATTFSGFYLAITLVLFGLIVRAVSIEYADRDPKPGWRKLWNALFFIGSLLPALLLGVAVGNVFAGIPMDANGDYCGVPLLGLLSPFTLLCGVLGLLLFMLQGAWWLSAKTPEDSTLRERCINLRMPLTALAVGVFIILTFMVSSVWGEMYPPLTVVRIAAAVLFLVLILAALFTTNGAKDDLRGFILCSASLLMLIALLATSMFPTLVFASGGVGQSITIATAASTDTALLAMTVIACIGVPLVLIWHFIVYRTFRGRIPANGESY